MTMRRVGIVRRSIAVALLLLLLPVGAVVDAQAPRGTELRDVNVTTQPDAVTIVVKTTGEVKYQAELVDHPYRLVLDFEDTNYSWRKSPLPVEAEPLKQIRGSQYRKGVARVDLSSANGIILGNSSGKGIVRMFAIAREAGQVYVMDSDGSVSVEMGTLAEGEGVVRLGPTRDCVPTIPQRVPVCIRGRGK